MAFSKQELRKVIKEYPGKEVKRGLDHLYKKVEKHLCEEENLLQVSYFISLLTLVTITDLRCAQFETYIFFF